MNFDKNGNFWAKITIFRASYIFHVDKILSDEEKFLTSSKVLFYKTINKIFGYDEFLDKQLKFNSNFWSK